MVGGPSEPDFLSPRPLEQSSAAVASVDEWHRSGGSQPPFATTRDVGQYTETFPPNFGSPTYGLTVDKPPFATSGVSVAPCSLDTREFSMPSAPYATSGNIHPASSKDFQPADVSYGAMERRSENLEKRPPAKSGCLGSTPFATGNGWD